MAKIAAVIGVKQDNGLQNVPKFEKIGGTLKKGTAK